MRRYDIDDGIYIPKTVAERVQMRPQVLFGSKDSEGCLFAISNIIENSIDEARCGFGDKIYIKRYEDNSIEVIDYGRGIPVEYNEKLQKYGWETSFCEMYSEVTHKEDNGDLVYSLSFHGMNLCCAQCASEYMDAEIYRDGYVYNLHFEKGVNIGGLKQNKLESQVSGTRLKFKLSEDVFSDTYVDYKTLDEMIRRFAICNRNISFFLEFDNGKEKYKSNYSYSSLSEVITDYFKDNSIETYEHTTNFKGLARKYVECTGEIRIATAFCDSPKQNESFFNNRYLEHGGIAIWELEKMLADVLKEIYANSNQDDEEFNKKIENVIGKIYIIACVGMTPSTGVSWQSGARKAIVNPIVGDTIRKECHKLVHKLITNNKREIDKLLRTN